MSSKPKEQKLTRQRELTEKLRQAARAYYQESREIMTNQQYDDLYDELKALEEETGITLAGSPTVTVGYEVLSELAKETHPERMLSLDKTKDPDQLVSWLGAQEGILSWKLDGLTIVLTYRDGRLLKAVTRGIDALGEVTVRVTSESGEVYTGRGSDNDIIVSSTKAYINALNRLISDQRQE